MEDGGPPAVCAGLSDALAARGHRVAVATLDRPGETQVPLSPMVRLITLLRSNGGRYASSHDLDQWIQHHVQEFDIVHLHSIWQFPTFAAARACWHQHKPYVVLLNGMLDCYSVRQHSYLLKRAYWLWRERKVEGRAAGIHFLNRAEIRRAVPWVARMPRFILGNGIDADQLASLPPRGGFRARHPELRDAPLILFLSRVHPKKGLDRLIPAWRSVAQRIPAARLLVAGTGDRDYVDSLQKLAADNGLKDQVVFVGQLVGQEKWEALVDADLFVLPSRQEAFSIAIAEALAAGCPPVVTEECNFDELEPAPPARPCGIIIRNGDMKAFCDKVVELCSDRTRLAAFAEAGKELVASRYTWQTIASELEKIYADILAGKEMPAAS